MNHEKTLRQLYLKKGQKKNNLMIQTFTICSTNYLAQAILLGNSLLKYNPDYHFSICLVDKKIPDINYSAIPFDIIEIESLNIPGFANMTKIYNVTELNTAAKPFFFRHLCENQKSEIIIYFDPDIYFYSALNDLEGTLESNEIILTPHLTIPVDDGKLPSENDFLNAGLYNLGFLAIRKTENTQLMIDWWANRLINKGFIDFEKGMFTDQLWMNFTPLFFQNVLIFRHPGYNMAYWNLHERQLSEDNGTYSVNGKPLVFFHFSGYSPDNPESLSKYQTRYSFENRKELIDLFSKYRNNLLDAGYKDFGLFKCCYSIVRGNYLREKARENLRKISIPKRIVRSIILRLIRIFKITI